MATIEIFNSPNSTNLSFTWFDYSGVEEGLFLNYKDMGQLKAKRNKPRFIWTKSLCKKEALKYKSRVDFCNNSSTAYQATLRNNWGNEVCQHMVYLAAPKGYWTLERCRIEALKYETRSDFKKNNRAHAIAQNRGWLDDVCGHMGRKGNKYNKCVYAYEFRDNCVYVGLTCDIKRRHKYRMRNKKDAVMVRINKTGITPKIIILTDYIPYEDAAILEGHFIDQYKKNGWNILNRAKAGALGGGLVKWDKETCKKEALKYRSRKEFAENCWGAYAASLNNGWGKEVCSHMEYLCTPNGYWSKDVCRRIALKYTNKKDMTLDYPGAMCAMYNGGWITELCSHMKNMRGNEAMKRKSKELYGKTVFKYTMDGVFLESFICAGDAAESVGVSRSLINACCNKNNRHKTCKGFVWEYKELNKKDKS